VARVQFDQRRAHASFELLSVPPHDLGFAVPQSTSPFLMVDASYIEVPLLNQPDDFLNNPGALFALISHVSAP
jgi:hypothetical protein